MYSDGFSFLGKSDDGGINAFCRIFGITVKIVHDEIGIFIDHDNDIWQGAAVIVRIRPVPLVFFVVVTDIIDAGFRQQFAPLFHFHAKRTKHFFRRYGVLYYSIRLRIFHRCRIRQHGKIMEI